MRAGRSSRRLLLPLCALVATAGACARMPVTTTSTIDWTIAFDTPERAAAAVRIEAEVRSGSCTGALAFTMPSLVLERDAGALPELPRLPPGEYCVRAEAFDRSCVRFASGEALVTLGSTTTTTRLVLRPADTIRACPAYTCEGGVCMPSRTDAGTDAPIILPDSPIFFPDTPFDAGPRPDTGPPDELPPLLDGCTEPGPSVTSMSLGTEHSCAITAGGHLYCWGADDDGRVGAGELRHEVRVPIEVAAPGAASWVRVAAGGGHTCAIDSLQALYCWGRNDHGQLGLGTVDGAAHPIPTLVPGLAEVIAVDVGASHTCAVAAGTLSCWGANDRRQLGTAMPGPDVATPMPVAAEGVGDIALGDAFGCAMQYDGAGLPTTTCWGAAGPWLGRTTGDGRPATLALDSYPNALTAGASHACGVFIRNDFTGSSVECWGEGDDGRLALGSTVDVVMPSPVPGTEGPAFITFTTAAAGDRFTCFTFPGESVTPYVACVGDGSVGATGPRGEGTTSLTPVPVLQIAFTIAAGGAHACAMHGAGMVCWGDNARGQLGTGTAAPFASAPARVCF